MDKASFTSMQNKHSFHCSSIIGTKNVCKWFSRLVLIHCFQWPHKFVSFTTYTEHYKTALSLIAVYILLLVT